VARDLANVRKAAGHPFGIHRVLDKKVCLPQAAEKLDNSLPIYANEILIDVERLNIDAASFVQMEKEASHRPEGVSKIILDNLVSRGKQQNRVTGSGGMLVGSVKQVGPDYRGALRLKAGDRIASLVSLTLTPLHLHRIRSVKMATHQLEVEGHAVLFESSCAALLPKDLPEPVAMAIFDVAGAPAYTASLCRPGMTVVVIGAGGKAGLLSVAAARRKMGRSGKIIAIEPFAAAQADLDKLGAVNTISGADATDPVAVHEVVHQATRGKLADLVINVASVPDTENSALLSVKGKGKVLFFSMATSFTKVALGAEGVACAASLIFGNGYYPNHSRTSVDLVRKTPKLKDIFLRRYGG